jgi:hypothetical protein
VNVYFKIRLFESASALNMTIQPGGSNCIVASIARATRQACSRRNTNPGKCVNTRIRILQLYGDNAPTSAINRPHDGFFLRSEHGIRVSAY